MFKTILGRSSKTSIFSCLRGNIPKSKMGHFQGRYKLDIVSRKQSCHTLAHTVPLPGGHCTWDSVISDDEEGLNSEPRIFQQGWASPAKLKQAALQSAHWTNLRKKEERNREWPTGITQGSKKCTKGTQWGKVALCPNLLLPAKESGPHPVEESAVLFLASFCREMDLTMFTPT